MKNVHPVMQAALAGVAPRPTKTDADKLNRLLAILNDRCDTVDGPDGQPRPNEAMSILTEYEGWLEGWVK